jgi:hypothetical protein
MDDLHDRSRLGAYVLGVLDAEEARAVDEHVASCPECRQDLQELAEMGAMLGEVPPEAFLDGPPDGGDLLLQRTLRRVRAESAAPVQTHRAPGRRRLALVAASVAVIAGAALGSGVLIGQRTATVTAEPSAAVSPSGRPFSATDPTTGARLTGTLTAAAGWVRLHVKVEGVHAGEQCQLVVTSRNGVQRVAGSWMVSPVGERDGTVLDGAALVPAADVATVEVRTIAGTPLVSVTL